MTSRIRFADAAAVFEAFPRLDQLAPKPSDEAPPLDHARSLAASPRPVTALVFISHLLPRREAVWWGAQCVTAVLGPASSDEGMRLANQWVRDPDEGVRRAALDFSSASGLQTATSWLARAVGHSGGSILGVDQPPTPPTPDACALSVNAAIVIATTAQRPLSILPWIRACADAGIRFAEGESVRIAPPSVR
jgi:hypothetical protein